MFVQAGNETARCLEVSYRCGINNSQPSGVETPLELVLCHLGNLSARAICSCWEKTESIRFAKVPESTSAGNCTAEEQGSESSQDSLGGL